MPIIGDFQFKGGLPFPSGAAAALYPKPIDSPETVVAGTSVEKGPKEIWRYTGDVSMEAVELDLQGNIFFGADGGSTNEYAVGKISADGQLLWTSSGYEYEKIEQIAVDVQGNVYVNETYAKAIKKMDGNGTQVWRLTGFREYLYCIAVDLQGNVYFGGADKIVHKNNSDGTQVWTFTEHAANIFTVETDSQGNVYSGDFKGKIFKISSTGEKVWEFFTGSESWIEDIAVDTQGNVYIAGYDKTTRKINSDGTQAWSRSVGYFSQLVEVDSQGNVYNGLSNSSLRRHNAANGAVIWAYTSLHVSNYMNLRGMTTDIQGNVYVACYDKSIRKIFDGYIIHTTS